MKIRIFTFAKNLEAALRPFEEDYRKRLSKFYPTEFVEIRREPLVSDQAFKKDWEKVRAKIGKDFLILLDEKGKQFSSQELARELGRLELMGRNISLVIGGPEGFPESVKQEADRLLSLSNLTLPHKLVRLFLIETLYRSNDILRNGPYHKD